MKPDWSALISQSFAEINARYIERMDRQMGDVRVNRLRESMGLPMQVNGHPVGSTFQIRLPQRFKAKP